MPANANVPLSTSRRNASFRIRREYAIHGAAVTSGDHGCDAGWVNPSDDQASPVTLSTDEP